MRKARTQQGPLERPVRPGIPGKNGATGPTGSTGQAGFTKTLPPGETETGTWAAADGQPAVVFFDVAVVGSQRLEHLPHVEQQWVTLQA